MRALLFLLCLASSPLFCQPLDHMGQARAQYALGNYATTIRTLRADQRLLREEPEAALLLAVSLFHTNDLTTAENTLKALIAQRGEDFPVARFYLGRVYHAQNLFAEAAFEYKRYLRTLRRDGEAWLVVTALLRNVGNGLRLSGQPEDVVVENLGPNINSPEDEFGPIPSPTGSGRLYFTAATSPQTDILVSTVSGNGWSPRSPLNPLLNTSTHEALVDISDSGRHLYYFRGRDEQNGEYLIDTFRSGSDAELITLPAGLPLSVDGTDVTPFLGAPDAIYFASDRPGGYGGLDLYRRRRLPEGGFGPAENLGPQVNGPYDEVTPFVARDGRTVYFSTNDPEYSMGGFDVVSSFRVLGSEGSFTRPENAGLPVNSPGDDTYFRLAPDTFTAFLASDRKDGLGHRDIYIAYYPTARPEMQ